MNPEAVSQLGKDDGPLKGKSVRRIGPGLPDHSRNSPATVLNHYPVTDTVTIRNHGGSVSTCSATELYLMTGREKPPMSELPAYLRKVKRMSRAMP